MSNKELWLAVLDYPVELDELPYHHGVYKTPEAAIASIDNLFVEWELVRGPWSHEGIDNHHGRFFFCEIRTNSTTFAYCTAYVTYVRVRD